MSGPRRIVNLRTSQVILARVSLRAGFFGRLLGLQGRERLAEDEGILFRCCCCAGRLSAAIHTLGMRMTIGVVWLDADLHVVDMKLALPWKFAYVPRAAARYYLEASPAVFDKLQVGDQLRIEEDLI